MLIQKENTSLYHLFLFFTLAYNRASILYVLHFGLEEAYLEISAVSKSTGISGSLKRESL